MSPGGCEGCPRGVTNRQSQVTVLCFIYRLSGWGVTISVPMGVQALAWGGGGSHPPPNSPVRAKTYK